jgi:ribonuclease HI
MDKLDFKKWIFHQVDNILFFDGVSRNNQREAGVGVIYKPRGEPLIKFSWGLGSISNNEAKALALYATVRLAHTKGIQNHRGYSKYHCLWRLLINYKNIGQRINNWRILFRGSHVLIP